MIFFTFHTHCSAWHWVYTNFLFFYTPTLVFLWVYIHFLPFCTLGSHFHWVYTCIFFSYARDFTLYWVFSKPFVVHTLRFNFHWVLLNDFIPYTHLASLIPLLGIYNIPHRGILQVFFTFFNQRRRLRSTFRLFKMSGSDTCLLHHLFYCVDRLPISGKKTR